MYPQEIRETLPVNKVKARTDSQVWLLTSTHAAWHMFMYISIYKPTCVYTHTYMHTKSKRKRGSIKKQLGHEYLVLKNGQRLGCRDVLIVDRGAW